VADTLLLASLVERELRRVEAFVALLRQEQSLLETSNTESLATLAGEKTRLATELTQLCQAREAELTRLGLGIGKDGMNAWCEATDAGSRSRWQGLLKLGAEARSLNEQNGKLITIKLQNNQRALAVLAAAADQATTYGPDGQQQVGTGGRTLGKA
jgi:flagellar biosynthesis protein FlgN